MAELNTATAIATPEDGDILPIRKAGVAGLLKITLKKISDYVKAELGIPDTVLDAEAIRDLMGAVLVAGDDITITVDDAANTITIDSTASGGGGTSSVRIVAFATTAPDDAEVISIYPVAEDITFPANFAGSVAGIANGGVNPAAAFTANVYDDATLIGTIALNTSGVPTLATVSGTSKAVAAGSFVTVVGPATADTAIANFAATLVADID